MASSQLGAPPGSATPLDPHDPVLTNPTVALAVKSFRVSHRLTAIFPVSKGGRGGQQSASLLLSGNMRSAALTPVARRLRDIMLKRNPHVPPPQPAAADWTEVTIACPPLPAKAAVGGAKRMIPPGQLIRDTVGADILVLVGAVLAFLGSSITLLATYGHFSNPETRPLVLGMGPPLVGIGFVFCLLRLFFCKPHRLPGYRWCSKLCGRNAVHPRSARPPKRPDKRLEETSAVCKLHFEPRFILRDYVHIIGGKEVRIACGHPPLTPDAVPTLLPGVLQDLSEDPPACRTRGKPFFLNGERKPKRDHFASDGYHLSRFVGIRALSRLIKVAARNRLGARWVADRPRLEITELYKCCHCRAKGHTSWACLGFRNLQ
ncbi:hypothetical protein HPB47_024522 [Ixodes persulcatus]|uniref:Uncharacterized protein n=1 Tax=Ixodes persulcatus TaxID=34615 RepID=A0AC60Q672_IXOPE|nr:hypothetical protein HPB47_024522 [Ixodes persulcatus]